MEVSTVLLAEIKEPLNWSLVRAPGPCPLSRYMAICHPMRAQAVCTVARAKRILAGLWSGTCLYCTLWLFLVDIQVSQPLSFKGPLLL